MARYSLMLPSSARCISSWVTSAIRRSRSDFRASLTAVARRLFPRALTRAHKLDDLVEAHRISSLGFMNEPTRSKNVMWDHTTGSLVALPRRNGVEACEGSLTTPFAGPICCGPLSVAPARSQRVLGQPAGTGCRRDRDHMRRLCPTSVRSWLTASALGRLGQRTLLRETHSHSS